jgi:hypothetical protein
MLTSNQLLGQPMCACTMFETCMTRAQHSSAQLSKVNIERSISHHIHRART